MPTPRIVSLVPSATETVAALGAAHQLVGRSHVCDYPAQVEALPVLTRPRLALESSRGIHDELRELLAAGLAIYDLDLEKLRALAPTHLLVQDQCAVCAVSPSDLETALAEWLGEKPTLVRLEPHQLHDVWADLERVGHAIGRGSQANQLRQRLSERLSEIAEAVGGATTRPRVACIEWLEPVMIAGHWVPELVRIAGGLPVLSEVGGASLEISPAELLASEPDVLVVQACGFDMEVSRRAWHDAADLRAAIAGSPAPGGPVDRADDPSVEEPTRGIPTYLSDGAAFFNRPGPRLVESAEILAEILHPERFAVGHRDRDFVSITPR